MINVESYRQNAADCLRQAEAEAEPDDKNLLLNVALAWVRLAQQVQEVGIPTPSDQTPDAEASNDDAIATQAGGDKVAPAAANDDADPDTDRPLVTH